MLDVPVYEAAITLSHGCVMVLYNAEPLNHLDVAKFCNGLNGALNDHFVRIMQKHVNVTFL